MLWSRVCGVSENEAGAMMMSVCAGADAPRRHASVCRLAPEMARGVYYLL